MGQLRQPMTQADLAQARTLLNQEGPAAMYSYLEGFGDRYATLAKGVVTGDTLSGTVALEFLERSAERQGVDLTPQKLDQVRWGLADRYLSTLESIVQDTGSVTEELRSRPIWNIHSEELSKYGLDKDAWTLNTPFELMGDRQREAYWEAVLDSAGDPGREFELAKDTALKMAAMHQVLESLGFWLSLSNDGEELRVAADKIEAWASRIADLDTLGDSFGVGLYAAFDWVDDLLRPVFEEMAKDFLDFAFGLGDFIREIEDAVADFFGQAKDWVRPRDPLVLDLDGDGIETVGLDAGIRFDHDGDGVLSRTGWVGPDDALLVRDRDGDGQITRGAELFGDFTPLSDGRLANNGFQALSDLDANGDGVVDASDPAFNELKLWQDRNQDGVSQADELIALSDAGIASLSTSGVLRNQALGNGNRLAREGGYARTDGTTGTLGELDPAIDTFDSAFRDLVPVPDAVKTLPNMGGSGKVRELRQAA